MPSETSATRRPVIVRALLDTQILVRGLLSIRRPACALAFEALADERFTAIVSPHILGEPRAVLSLPNLDVHLGKSTERVTDRNGQC
jgi:predicted nucleic acid-binding protein